MWPLCVRYICKTGWLAVVTRVQQSRQAHGEGSWVCALSFVDNSAWAHHFKSCSPQVQMRFPTKLNTWIFFIQILIYFHVHSFQQVF